MHSPKFFSIRAGLGFLLVLGSLSACTAQNAFELVNESNKDYQQQIRRDRGVIETGPVQKEPRPNYDQYEAERQRLRDGGKPSYKD